MAGRCPAVGGRYLGFALVKQAVERPRVQPMGFAVDKYPLGYLRGHDFSSKRGNDAAMASASAENLPELPVSSK
jgi:hypothetical protein